MTYLVTTGDEDGRAHHWWASFLAYGMDLSEIDVQAALDKHNSHAKISWEHCFGDNIEFETEYDYLAFVLRWS